MIVSTGKIITLEKRTKNTFKILIRRAKENLIIGENQSVIRVMEGGIGALKKQKAAEAAFKWVKK